MSNRDIGNNFVRILRKDSVSRVSFEALCELISIAAYLLRSARTLAFGTSNRQLGQ